MFPSIVAKTRQLENLSSHFVLNRLLGWTGLGWIVLLIWAIVGRTKDAQL
jgi:hypothetical protein